MIEGFNKIAAPLTTLLKITGSPNNLASSRNHGSRSAFNRNNDSKPASNKNDSNRPASSKNNGNSLDCAKNDGNGEVDGFGGDSIGHAKKSEKSKKLFKSQKLSKSGKFKGEKSKKLSKSEDSPNFNNIKTGPSFITLRTREVFNCLRLTFTKAPILHDFDLKCHIWIKINVLNYAINNVLSQLAFGTRPDGIVTKTNLGQWHQVAFFSRKMILVKI